MFKGLLVGLANFFVVVGTNCGYYQTWQNLQRTVHESQYNKVEVSTYEYYMDLEVALNKVNYSGDGLSRFFDSASNPRRVEDLIQNPRLAGDVDCDDYAGYIVAALNKSKAEGVLKEDLRHAYYMLIRWSDDSDWLGTSGHAVALLQRTMPDGSIKWSYMDYGVPSQARADVSQVYNDITAAYSTQEKKLTAVSVTVYDIDPKTYGMNFIYTRIL